MSKKISEGCFLYQTGMEGIDNLRQLLDNGMQSLFKDIYVNGVGIKRIDKIEGNVITFNQGYKAIDDYVIYEIYNDEASVLTTVKKIDANNFKCSEDISAIKGAASMRIPPIGLEYAEKTPEGDSDIYLNKSGNAFLVPSNIFIRVKKTKDSKVYIDSDRQVGVDVIFVSEHEIILPNGKYIGVTTDGLPVVDRDSGYKIIHNESVIEDKNGDVLFPRNSSKMTGVSISRTDNIAAHSTVFSDIFVGKNRSMLRNCLSSSSNSAATDFYMGANGGVSFIHHNDSVIAIAIGQGYDTTGVAVRVARIES